MEVDINSLPFYSETVHAF